MLSISSARITNIMQNKYLRLMRMHSLTGFVLVAAPCWFGIGVSAQNIRSYARWMCWFTIGALLMRIACCIVNDMMDMDIDAKVERTKDRPLASGDLGMKEAFCVLAAVLAGCFAVFLQLNLLAKAIALAGFLLACVYPLSKRFMKAPQIFLSITISIGALASYAAVAGAINANAVALYFACVSWSMGSDTIYSCQDAKHDRDAGVSSIAVCCNGNVEKLVYNFYSAFLLVVLLLGFKLKLYYIFYIVCIFVAYMLYVQVFCTDFKKPDACMKAFKKNSAVGIFLACGFFLGRFIK